MEEYQTQILTRHQATHRDEYPINSKWIPKIRPNVIIIKKWGCETINRD